MTVYTKLMTAFADSNWVDVTTNGSPDASFISVYLRDGSLNKEAHWYTLRSGDTDNRGLPAGTYRLPKPRDKILIKIESDGGLTSVTDLEIQPMGELDFDVACKWATTGPVPCQEPDESVYDQYTYELLEGTGVDAAEKHVLEFVLWQGGLPAGLPSPPHPGPIVINFPIPGAYADFAAWNLAHKISIASLGAAQCYAFDPANPKNLGPPITELAWELWTGASTDPGFGGVGPPATEGYLVGTIFARCVVAPRSRLEVGELRFHIGQETTAASRIFTNGIILLDSTNIANSLATMPSLRISTRLNTGAKMFGADTRDRAHEV